MNHLIYIGCAAVGGAVLLLQLLLLLLGSDADVDADFGDVDGGGFGDDGGLHVFSIRAMAGFLTFFGLVGWWGATEGWGAARTLIAATVTGGISMVAVAWLFSLQKRLDTKGNIDFKNVVGLAGKVYLRIPAERASAGKITVAVQGRSMEFSALTAGPEIPTGADIRVLAMTSPGTFEVAPFNSTS